MATQASKAANPGVQHIPAHLQNRHTRPGASSAGASGGARPVPRKPAGASPAHATSSSGTAAGAVLRAERVPRDEREAKKMEMDQFHALLLSLDVTIDGSRKGGSGQKEPKRALKGRFASNQDYVDTFGPLVMEEIRAELLQERVEQGPSSFRPAVLRELQTSHQSADFHYLTLALDLSTAASGGVREFYENGDCVVVQTKVLTWQKASQPEGVLSPLTRRALDLLPPAKSAGASAGADGPVRFKGGQKSTFEGESTDTPPGSSMRDPRLTWSVNGREQKEQRGKEAAGGGEGGGVALPGPKGEWVQSGAPLEFLAMVVNARKEAGGGSKASGGGGVGNAGGGMMALKLRAVRSLNLDVRVGGGASGAGQGAGGSGRRVVWKVMRLKHMGPSIREWRAGDASFHADF